MPINFVPHKFLRQTRTLLKPLQKTFHSPKMPLKASSAFVLVIFSLTSLPVPAKAQIGLLCAKDSDCKVSSSFVCGPNKSCVCDRGHRFDLLKFSCSRHLVNHQDKCDPNQDVCKGGPNSICQATFLGEKATCKCKDKTVFDYQTELCKSPDFVTDPLATSDRPPIEPTPGALGALPGEACSQNSDCRFFPNATCYYFVDSSKRECYCNYDTHYYDQAIKECRPKKGMGAPCQKVEECVNISNAECSNVLQVTKTRKCACKMDYYYSKTHDVCHPTAEIGEECQSNEECKARPNSYCKKPSANAQYGVCECRPGKFFYRGSRTCVEAPGNGKLVEHGHPCMPSSKCQGGPHAVCKNLFIGMNPVCTCKDGYEFDQALKVCREEGSHPSDVPQEGGGEMSGNGNQFDIKLAFNILLHVVCDQRGKCKTSSAQIEEARKGDKFVY